MADYSIAMVIAVDCIKTVPYLSTPSNGDYRWKSQA